MSNAEYLKAKALIDKFEKTVFKAADVAAHLEKSTKRLEHVYDELRMINDKLRDAETSRARSWFFVLNLVDQIEGYLTGGRAERYLHRNMLFTFRTAVIPFIKDLSRLLRNEIEKQIPDDREEGSGDTMEVVTFSDIEDPPPATKTPSDGQSVVRDKDGK